MKDKLKIAFIGTNDYPIPAIYGGAIQTLVTALLDENEKVHNFDIDVYTVFAAELNKATKKYNFTHFIPIKNDIFSKSYLLLVRILRRITHNAVRYNSIYMKKIFGLMNNNNYDAIIFETTDKEVVQLPRKIKESSKIIYHIHADYLNNETDRICEIVDKVDYFVGVSNFIKYSLGKIATIDQNHIKVLKNAIDINDIYINNENEMLRTNIRKKYGFSDNDMVLMFCGRLSPEKGCLELIKAVNKLEHLDGIKLMIIGGDNFSSNKTTEYVNKLYKEANRQKNKIKFVGYVPHKNVRQYMLAADVGIVPSVCNESCSLTLMEYRSVKLPTIATNIGGIPEYCTPESTCLVKFDRLYIQNLADAIEEIYTDVERRNKMKKHAVMNLNEFGYVSYYKRFSEMIYQICKK